MVREAIRRARANGAHEWRGRGFRDSEAGAGAWGAHRMGADGQWQPYDADGHASGGGDALYMSNNKFVMVIAILAGIAVWAQWVQIDNVVDTSRASMIDRHVQ